MKLFYLKQCVLFFGILLSFCMMLSLITFHPFDDTCFQFTGNDVFHNLFGKLGASFADILFFVFGFLAYLFPCMIFFLNWIYFSKKKSLDLFNFLLKIVGCVALLFALCGLIEFFVNDLYYYFSGGIIGIILRVSMSCMLNDIMINITFLIILVLGIFLLKNNNKKKYLLYKKFFLDQNIKLQSIKNELRGLTSKFRHYFNKYLVEAKKSQSGKPQRIKCKNILKGLLTGNSHIFNMILNIKNYFRLIRFNFYNFLFRKSRIFKLNHNNVGFENIKSHYKLSYGEFFGYVRDVIPKKSKRNQKIISNGSIIEQSVFQTNTLKSLKKQNLFTRSSELFPSIDLLSAPPLLSKFVDIKSIKKKSKLLELKLAEYHIQVHVVDVLQGPVVTRFELDLAPGIKSSRISSLSRDLARSLSICNLRIIEVIPGKPYVGLEIPNEQRDVIYLREILDSEKFRTSLSCLTLGMGKDVSGVPVVADLINMPHLLIAGTTGSGKSVGINSMIISILYKSTPEDVRFVMIDSKILELSIYDGIPHLITNVATDMNDIVNVLNWCVKEMDRRYKMMACCGARNLDSYNHRVQSSEIGKCSMDDTSMLILKKLPYIVVVVDEFADLVISSGKEVESLIVRLSQKSRACGMHLILATQRPSVNVITGLIKANIPSRIAFTVSSKVDSHTILDCSGAESLLGMGDMLYLGSQSFMPIRIHGAFISDEEISLIARHWKNIFHSK